MRRLLAGASLLAAGCSLPARDNPFDPSTAPRVSLLVVDRSRPDGSCPAEDDFSGPAVVTASRGRCLGLDATGTDDPQGADLESLDFSFSVVSSGELIVLEHGVDGTFVPPARFALSRERLRTLAVNDSLLEFRASARDRGGSVGRGSVEFLLTNARPRAAGNAARRLLLSPVAGASKRVEFSGSRSFDADGDPLTFRWTFPVELAPTTTTFSADPVFRDVPLTARRRYVATMWASDGRLESDPVAVELSVGEPVVWLSGSSEVVWESIDGARLVLDLPDAAQDARKLAAALLDDGRVVATWATASTASTANLVRVFDLDGNALSGFGSFPLSYDVPDAESAGGDDVWLAFSDTEGQEAQIVARWDVSGVPTQAVSADVGPITSLFENSSMLLAADRDGNAWVTGIFGSNIVLVEPDGDAVRVLDTSGRFVTAMATRPVLDEEVWTVEAPDPLGGVGTGEVSIVKRTAAAGVVERFPVEADFATGLAWAGVDRFWTFVPGEGLVLVDVTRLEAVPGTGVLASADLVLPAENVLFLTADAVTGTVWAKTFSDRAYLASVDGRIRDAASSDKDEALYFVDPRGMAWFEGQRGIRRGFSVDGFGVESRVALATETGVPDGSIGGLWLSGVLPTGLYRYAASGELDEVVTNVLLNGAVSTVPIYAAIEAPPDAGALWALPDSNVVADTRIHYLHMGVRPPAGKRLLDVTAAEDIESHGLFLPVPTGPPRIFVAMPNPGGGIDISVLDTNGGLALLETLDAEQPTGYASSPVTPEMCMLSTMFMGTAQQPTLRSLHADAPGSVVLSLEDVLGLPSRVDASWDEENGLVCWVAWTQAGVDPGLGTCPPEDLARGYTEIVGFRMSDAVTVATFVEPTVVLRDLVMMSPSRFLMSVEGCAGVEDPALFRLHVSIPPGGTPVVERVGPLQSDRGFLHPRRP